MKTNPLLPTKHKLYTTLIRPGARIAMYGPMVGLMIFLAFVVAPWLIWIALIELGFRGHKRFVQARCKK